MFRVAFKFDIDPRDPDWRRTWRVTACWKVNESASRVVKVERKDRTRKRLLLLSPTRFPIGMRINPLGVLDVYRQFKADSAHG